MPLNPQSFLTIGHSTRSIDELMHLLVLHRAALLADIRTIPRSRRHPQFNLENLAQSLDQQGMRYLHIPQLGGLRKPKPDSINTGWENLSFRGYADYMQTSEFIQAIEQLIILAHEQQPIVLMCAEAVPWRCHRSLVADALLARGHAVTHILSATQTRPHVTTKFAVVENHRVTYPPLQGNLPV